MVDGELRAGFGYCGDRQWTPVHGGTYGQRVLQTAGYALRSTESEEACPGRIPGFQTSVSLPQLNRCIYGCGAITCINGNRAVCSCSVEGKQWVRLRYSGNTCLSRNRNQHNQQKRHNQCNLFHTIHLLPFVFILSNDEACRFWTTNLKKFNFYFSVTFSAILINACGSTTAPMSKTIFLSGSIQTIALG